jgi:hypothetical protein
MKEICSLVIFFSFCLGLCSCKSDVDDLEQKAIEFAKNDKRINKAEYQELTDFILHSEHDDLRIYKLDSSRIADDKLHGFLNSLFRDNSIQIDSMQVYHPMAYHKHIDKVIQKMDSELIFLARMIPFFDDISKSLNIFRELPNTQEADMESINKLDEYIDLLKTEFEKIEAQSWNLKAISPGSVQFKSGIEDFLLFINSNLYNTSQMLDLVKEMKSELDKPVKDIDRLQQLLPQLKSSLENAKQFMENELPEEHKRIQFLTNQYFENLMDNLTTELSTFSGPDKELLLSDTVFISGLYDYTIQSLNKAIDNKILLNNRTLDSDFRKQLLDKSVFSINKEQFRLRLAGVRN